MLVMILVINHHMEEVFSLELKFNGIHLVRCLLPVGCKYQALRCMIGTKLTFLSNFGEDKSSLKSPGVFFVDYA